MGCMGTVQNFFVVGDSVARLPHDAPMLSQMLYELPLKRMHAINLPAIIG